jgi:hypothetical protein
MWWCEKATNHSFSKGIGTTLHMKPCEFQLRISFAEVNNDLHGDNAAHVGWSTYLRGSFEKFVDSTYYSESELYGGAVTVSLSKYLPWQACISYNAPPTSQKRAADH